MPWFWADWRPRSTRWSNKHNCYAIGRGLFEALKANPQQLRVFIEEALRLRAPTQGLSTRLTSQDEEFGEVTIPRGSVLHLRWAAGNIDPEEFECPMDLQLDRKAASRHLSFSAGPRVCPGAGISRLGTADRLDATSRAIGYDSLRAG